MTPRHDRSPVVRAAVVARNVREASDINALVIGRLPAPCARTIAALYHALLVDFGNDGAIAGKQRLGRAHLGANRQFALDKTIGAILGVFCRRIVVFRSTCAVSALVHLAARAEVSDLRILGCTERTGVEAISAADAEVLRVKYDAVGR